MWKVAVTIISLSVTTVTILDASTFHCPEGTACYEQGAIESTSFQFLEKLGPKQYEKITKLTVLNSSLDKVPAKLKYVKKLEYLDLSDNNIQASSIPSLPHLKTLKLCRNNIKAISLTLLPKNIEDLDLSNNLLSQIPNDWSSLRSLKTLHLHQNQIDCDCYSNNIFAYETLIKQSIHIPEPVICYVPKHFAGKNINTIKCSAEDEMINDQPEEGSGAGSDIFTEAATFLAPYHHEEEEVLENEVIYGKDKLSQEQQFVGDEDTSNTATPEEGSGDLEGSGFAPIEIERIASCIFGCVTPEPIGSHDTKNYTSTIPSPADQIKIIAEDFFHPIFADISPSASAATTSETTSSTSSPTTFSPRNVNEEVIIKASHPSVYKEFGASNGTRSGEMEEAIALNHNNYTVYIVVVSGLLLSIVILVCLIKKRKAKRLNKNRCDTLSALGEEMKPLEKPSVQLINEKNGLTPNNNSEYNPLINGQSDKQQNASISKSFTSLEYPDLNSDPNQDQPIIRETSEVLTPVTERVTIRASEILESIPKTPVLVQRQKNSDGKIITTVVPA